MVSDLRRRRIIVQGAVRGVLYGAVRAATPLGDRAIQHAVDAGRLIEQSLAIHQEISRRLEWSNDKVGTTASETASPDRELVRETYAELRQLINQVDDPQLRERIASACAKLAKVSGPQQPQEQQTPVLSERERDVLACVALGRTNTQIANDLGLSSETVKSYLRSAMRKLGAHSRLEAVVSARRLRLLP
jgi:DNA-binding NarL/FixJ family response regulator